MGDIAIPYDITKRGGDEVKVTWKDRLRHYDNIYSNMHNHMGLKIKALSDDELKQLIEDLSQPSTTNCSWTLYAVMPIVKELVKYETQLRGW